MTIEHPKQKFPRINPWRILSWSIAAGLLLLPLVAMQFTDEVDWTVLDFAFAAVLIGGVGLTLEFVFRTTRNAAQRIATGLLLAASFLLIWINAAVGIIGNEDNPLNLLYGGVLLIAFGGTIVARFRPRGMVRAMAATAVVQTLVGAVAVFAGGNDPPGAGGAILLNGFFVVMFAGSAWLYRAAAADDARYAD